nr:insulinase family protein [Haliscomenobacter sp.]
MITYHRFVLDNGLRVLVHEDPSTPMAAVNVLYNVGSRDEHPAKTGFAHLFEHLMFGGSANIPDFDDPLQLAGGDNNAFTNNDFTNFYEVLPAQNLEVAFWLESDRMLSLNFDPQVLEVQRKVVVEEFKETCLNQPYGDMWHHLSEMAYQPTLTVGRSLGKCRSMWRVLPWTMCRIFISSTTAPIMLYWPFVATSN